MNPFSWRRPPHSHWEYIRSDRATGALAAGTVVIAVAVGVGQFTRRLNRRVHSEETHGLLENAPAAARDTFEVAKESLGAATSRETILFNLLAGFLGSFAAIRFVAWAIRNGRGPFRNVRLAGRHIHHFVPGILIAFGSGMGGLMADSSRGRNLAGLGLGVGAGLTFDETALLLDMRDVYWSREGLLSVQVSLATAATLGMTVLTLRLLDRGERLGESHGLIPVADGEIDDTGRRADRSR